MPRPVQQRIEVRADAPQEPNSPQLGTFAPLEGVRAAGGGKLSGLADILGAVGNAAIPLAKQYAAGTSAKDMMQGEADAELGHVDPQRAQQSIQYADAAHKVNVIKQFQDAQAQTVAWSTTGLDHSAPYADQTKLIDAKMQEELGALASDPKAAGIIAPRYQAFINNAATTILSNQTKARMNEALETARTDIGQAVANGGLTPELYGEHVATLTALTGDRTKAVSSVVQAYGDVAQDIASKGGDWKSVFNAIPTSIKLADGTTIPGPTVGGGRNHDTILRAKDAAQRAYNAWYEPQFDAAQATLFTHLDAQVHAGAMLTLKGMMHYTQPGPGGTKPLMTGPQVAEFINRASNRREALANQHAATAAIQATPNWANLVGQQIPGAAPGKVYTKESFQKSFDMIAGQSTNNFSDKDATQKVIALSAQYHMPSTNLKLQLTSVATPGSTAAAKAAVQQLPSYEAVKAAGLTSLYLSSDQTAFYENLATSQKGGANPTDLAQEAANYRPEQQHELVTKNLPEVMAAVQGMQREQHWLSHNTKYGEYANSAQVTSAARDIATNALLQNGGNIAGSAHVVDETMKQHWAPLDLGRGVKVLVPTEGRDVAGMQASVSAMTAAIPKIAKAAGADTALQDRAVFQTVNLPGQGTLVEVIDPDTGIKIPGTPSYPMDEFLSTANEIRTARTVQDMHDAHESTKAGLDAANVVGKKLNAGFSPLHAH